MNVPSTSSARSRIGSATCLLSVLLTLGGCAVGPDFTKPKVTVPKNWRETGDANVATENATNTLWWKVLDDPALDRLVDLAYDQNLSLQIAGLRIMEARAALAIVTGLQYPQTQIAFANATAIGISSPRHDRRSARATPSTIRWASTWRGKRLLGEIPAGGGRLGGHRARDGGGLPLRPRLAHRRSGANLRGDEDVGGPHRAGPRERPRAENALEIARSRFRNGETSELDPTQAATLLESTRATVPRRQFELQQARNSLSTLLGQPPGAVDELLAARR